MKKCVAAVAMLVLTVGWPVRSASPAEAKGAKVSLPDVEVERRIKERFAKSKIAASHFQVTVQAGVARIEGKTKVIQHKGVATRLAKLGGARKVDNRIEISAEAREKASSNLAEGRRRVATRTSQPPRSEPRNDPRAAEKPVEKAAEPRPAIVKWR